MNYLYLLEKYLPSPWSWGFKWWILTILFLVWIFIKQRIQLGKGWQDLQKVYIHNEELRCINCQYSSFCKFESLIKTSLVTYFDFGFLNFSSATYECKKCHFLHRFMKSKQIPIQEVKPLERD